MNIFRLIGDMSHLAGIIILLLKIWKTRSCSGVSGKTQIMFALVFLTRYLDLFTSFVSLYNSIMKVFFILSSVATVFLIYYKFKATYDSNHDTFRAEFLIVPVAGLAVLINHEFTILEVTWSFSVYCEAFAFIPQIFLILSKQRDVQQQSRSLPPADLPKPYIAALFAYRLCYAVTWYIEFTREDYFDVLEVISGTVASTVFLELLVLHIRKWWLKILWTFSIYLESVAILPQLFMISKTGEAETITSHYLFALGVYRGLYLFNWVYRYFMEGYFDLIAVVAGCVQTILYCDFFYLYITKVLKGKKLSLPA